MIYSPPILQPDWSEVTTMVQYSLQFLSYMYMYMCTSAHVHVRTCTCTCNIQHVQCTCLNNTAYTTICIIHVYRSNVQCIFSFHSVSLVCYFFQVSFHNLLFFFGFFFFQDDKAMKFRAGFRRVNVPSSTEYSLQYSWKDQVPEPSPIIRAEQLLNSQHLNQRGGPSNYRHNEETGGHSTKERETVSNGESFERRKPQVVSQQNSAGSKHDDVIDGSCDLEEHTRGRGEMVQRLRQESRVKSPPKEGGVRHAHGSGTKVSKRKHKSHHHSNSGSKKKHKSGRGFVSEYKREFKAWPIPSSTSVGVAYSISKGEDVHLQGTYMYMYTFCALIHKYFMWPGALYSNPSPSPVSYKCIIIC